MANSISSVRAVMGDTRGTTTYTFPTMESSLLTFSQTPYALKWQECHAFGLYKVCMWVLYSSTLPNRTPYI